MREGKKAETSSPQRYSWSHRSPLGRRRWLLSGIHTFFMKRSSKDPRSWRKALRLPIVCDIYFRTTLHCSMTTCEYPPPKLDGNENTPASPWGFISIQFYWSIISDWRMTLFPAYACNFLWSYSGRLPNCIRLELGDWKMIGPNSCPRIGRVKVCLDRWPMLPAYFSLYKRRSPIEHVERFQKHIWLDNFQNPV